MCYKVIGTDRPAGKSKWSFKRPKGNQNPNAVALMCLHATHPRSIYFVKWKKWSISLSWPPGHRNAHATFSRCTNNVEAS